MAGAETRRAGQERWAIYAAVRLYGHIPSQAVELTHLPHATCELRDRVIKQLIKEHWPALADWLNGYVDRSGIYHRSKPLRSMPFTSKEEAWDHHNHEYVQCLECGKIFSSLNIHLQTAHALSAQQYREKWQIMKQIPLAGFAKRGKHSASIKAKIARDDVDSMVLVAAMQEANRINGKKNHLIPTTSLRNMDNG